VLSFVYITQAVKNTNGITQKLKDNPPKIVYVQAKDGYTPVKGLDYFDGTAGINAVSYSITNNTVKEVPLVGTAGKDGADGLPGKDGINGEDAPVQQIRVNPDNGDMESKMSNQKFWETLVVCSDYRTVCP